MTAEVSVRAEGEYNIDFSLSTGIRGHTYKNKTARLAPGTHEIEIDFDGRAINENRKDGPWGIVVSLDGAGDEWLDSREHLTQPYRMDDFEPAPIMLTRTFDDRAVDRDANGLFDALRFTFGVEVHAESTATYHVAARLKDAPDNGRLLDLARAKKVLMPGIGTVTIGFDGAAMARGRTDGRYMVTLITIDNDENVEIGYFEPNYVTSPYRYWDFDPGTPEIAYLDTMLSRLEDTDGDGRAEYVVVSPLVKSSAAAHLMVSAALADRHGRLITQGTGATDIGREEHAYIDIRFDGRRVFGSLENGPYRVVDSRFHTHKAMVLWGPNVPPGETEPYRYDQFEPAAVITGVVEASHDSAAVLAEVRTIHSVDWTDSTGKYHLVFVDGDLDSLFVRTSHEAARRWDIYLNGQFLKTGDAVWMPIEIGRIDTLDFLAPRSR